MRRAELETEFERREFGISAWLATIVLKSVHVCIGRDVYASPDFSSVLLFEQVTRSACARFHQASADLRNEILRTRKGQATPFPRTRRPLRTGEP